MVDARPLRVLEERDAVILEDEAREVAVRFAIAHEDAELAVMPALVAHEAQDVRSRTLDLESPVGRLDELHALILWPGRAAVTEEILLHPTQDTCRREAMLLHPAQDTCRREAMLLREQVDGDCTAIAEFFACHAADGLQRPVRPIEERCLLQILGQVETHALLSL